MWIKIHFLALITWDSVIASVGQASIHLVHFPHISKTGESYFKSKSHIISAIKKNLPFVDLIIITDSGVLMRQPVAAIRTIGRVTQGVKLVKLDDGASISSITRVISDDEPVKETTEQEPENKEEPKES